MVCISTNWLNLIITRKFTCSNKRKNNNTFENVRKFPKEIHILFFFGALVIIVVIVCCRVVVFFLLPFVIIWRMIEPIGMAWMVLFLFYHFEMLLFWCWKSDAFFPLPILNPMPILRRKTNVFLFIYFVVGWNMPTKKWTKNYFDETKEKHIEKNSIARYVIHIRQWDGMCKKAISTRNNAKCDIIYITNVCKIGWKFIWNGP